MLVPQGPPRESERTGMHGKGVESEKKKEEVKTDVSVAVRAEVIPVETEKVVSRKGSRRKRD